MFFARLAFQLSSSTIPPHLSILHNQSLQHTSASSNINPDHRSLQQMDRTPISDPASSTPGSASVLNNAKNNHIHDNVITTNNTTNISSSASSLNLLHQSVSPNAILNSGGRADEARCHPGTRAEVIGLVEKSITQQYTGPQMLWLSGPAGAGKTAIMQTVAERCKKQDVPDANFFFFRKDSSRKDARPFVATIMHQIIGRYPSVGAAVEATLTSDPLLFRMGIQQQFHDLLHNALSTMHDTLPSLPPLVLLIDGLDKCDSEEKTEQRQLLQALDNLLIQMGRHVRVVIASRVEPQISMAFAQLRSQVNSIFLDDKYSPEKDIRLFVTDEFDRIKTSHPLAHKLGPEWPSALDIYFVVLTSSGQFIFAATVMRFIMYSPANPILSLQKLQGIVPRNKNSPFAHLDTVYAYILGQVEDQEAVKVLLSIGLIRQLANDVIVDLMTAYQSSFSEAVVNSCLLELASLMTVKSSMLQFFHASFPDFLQDKTRSKEYYIDIETFCTSAFAMWWPNQSVAFLDIIFSTLEGIQQPTREMTTALIEHNPTPTAVRFHCNDLVKELHRIYAPKHLEIFNQIMHAWTLHDPSIERHILQMYSQATFQEYSSHFHMDQLNPQTHSSALQTPPSISLTQSPSRQIRPPALQRQLSHSQISTSISLARSSTLHDRPSLRQLPLPIRRTPTIETRPPTPKTQPPSPSIHPPSLKTSRSIPSTRPSTSEARPAPSQVREPVRLELPTTPRSTEPLTPETRPSTPKSGPSTSQADPALLQVPRFSSRIPRPIVKALPSISQTRPTIATKKDGEASENGIRGGKGKSVKRL